MAKVGEAVVEDPTALLATDDIDCKLPGRPVLREGSEAKFS
jgi:hypothetical protein